MKIGIIYHEDFKKYDFGPGHPLRGYYVDGDIAFSLIKGNEKLMEKAEIVFFEPSPAKDEEILKVHNREYIDFLQALNRKGGYITLDTPVYKGMYDVARLFAGADILGASMVMGKTLDKSFVFGMMGHHAGVDFGGGFCLINDIAIMIEYLRRSYDLRRILVFDYAVNAGHGTINIFYNTPKSCVSIFTKTL